MDFTSWKDRNLDHENRCSAEPEDAKPFRIAGLDERSESDQTGAQERRGFHISVSAGDRNAKPFVGDGVFGIAADARVAGEFRRIAKILPARFTVIADAASPAQPRNPDTI